MENFQDDIADFPNLRQNPEIWAKLELWAPPPLIFPVDAPACNYIMLGAGENQEVKKWGIPLISWGGEREGTFNLKVLE